MIKSERNKLKRATAERRKLAMVEALALEICDRQMAACGCRMLSATPCPYMQASARAAIDFFRIKGNRRLLA